MASLSPFQRLNLSTNATTTNLPLIGFIFVTLFVLYAWSIRRRSKAPPGPRGLPWIGVPHLMPRFKEWLAYTDWANKFGPFVTVEVFGQTIAFLNDPHLARDLLDKRSLIYSDRPWVPMMELMGHNNWNVGFMTYGERFRQARKFLAQALTPEMVNRLSAPITSSAHTFLLDLLDNPKNFEVISRASVSRTIMAIFFGDALASQDYSEYLELQDQLILTTSRSGSPAAYLVNVFPLLRYLPTWFPGTGFHEEAKRGREIANKILNIPFEMAIRNKDRAESVVSILLDSKPDDGTRDLIAGCISTAYGAGVETSTSTILTFILAMALNPQVQQKARVEIESAIGTDRLPTLEDRNNNSIPYIDLIMTETFRWRPVGNIGLPHRLMKEDTVGKYTLPAGTVVFGNIWAITHDENNFANADAFVPERHLKGDSGAKVDPRPHVFGYGRRVCPGRNLAETSLWLTMACFLTVFDVAPAIGDDGKPIPIVIDYTSGIMSRPEKFACTIKPRSEKALSLIKQLRSS